MTAYIIICSLLMLNVASEEVISSQAIPSMDAPMFVDGKGKCLTRTPCAVQLVTAQW